MDAGTKEAINEQLRIAEELRRKADKGGDSDSDAESTQVRCHGAHDFGDDSYFVTREHP